MKTLCMILPLALILCFMFGCQDKAAMSELEKFKAQAAIEKQNKEIILKYYEELDKGNIEGAMEFYSPSLFWYAPSNSATPLSKEESHEFIKMVFSAFPKWNHKIEEIMAVGNKVITRTVETMVHEGEFLGIPATGNTIEFGSMSVYQLEDGKISEIREEGNMQSFFQQLGMELKPKEAEK
jgi:steroid delta-isomerase-like uncharacterized protein